MGGIEGKVNGFLIPFFAITNFSVSLGMYGVMNWVEGDPLNL